MTSPHPSPSKVWTSGPSLEEALEMGEQHISQATDTPLRPDAFDRSDAEKIEAIAPLFGQIMDILGLDLQDDSLSGTPLRVAKMYVQEIFAGLNPAHAPHCKTFENAYGYTEMLVERNIRVQSTCEHHFLPITGVAHVAYKSAGRVVGLSKINRLVNHYAKRPQVQERLTRQIAEALKEALGTPDVAVVIDAYHHCVASRGIQDTLSSTVTADFHGAFQDPDVRKEFHQLVAAKQ
jgi:GTP cyclohydrolase I